MTSEERIARRLEKARDLASEAQRFIDEVKAKRSRKRKPESAKDKKRAAKRQETAEIRAACLERANGFGELCGQPLDPALASLCHLDGGSGKRLQNQSVRNCVMEHAKCHLAPDGFDRSPLAWFDRVQAWAWRNGYEVPGKYQRLFALKNKPSIPIKVEER